MNVTQIQLRLDEIQADLAELREAERKILKGVQSVTKGGETYTLPTISALHNRMAALEKERAELWQEQMKYTHGVGRPATRRIQFQ